MITVAGIAALRQVIADNPNVFNSVARDAVEGLIRVWETQVDPLPVGVKVTHEWGPQWKVRGPDGKVRLVVVGDQVEIGETIVDTGLVDITESFDPDAFVRSQKADAEMLEAMEYDDGATHILHPGMTLTHGICNVRRPKSSIVAKGFEGSASCSQCHTLWVMSSEYFIVGPRAHGGALDMPGETMESQ